MFECLSRQAWTAALATCLLLTQPSAAEMRTEEPKLPEGGQFIAEPTRGPKGRLQPKLPQADSIGGPAEAASTGGKAQAATTDALGSHGPLANWDAVEAAVKRAVPGDILTIAPGTYRVGRRQVLAMKAQGTPEQPIVLRAESLGAVTIEVDFREATRIHGSHWIIENLEFVGVCRSHDDCEHALHLMPNSHHVVIRNNRMLEFSAAIKGSASDEEGLTGPSFITVEGNWMYNKTGRKTDNPVTPVDVNGGREWVVRGNYIADFAKLGGNETSYGAFLKRNSFDGLFEGNLVVCAQRHTGGIRHGLSFGGGGTKASIEHTNGTMRNNIVMNCSDVGIHLARAANSRIYNNTLYNTAGIDVRFEQSTADIRNNVLTGRIKDRNGGSHESQGDIAFLSDSQFAKWYVDPERGDFRLKPGASLIGTGVAAPGVERDFCGRPRNGAMVPGAVAAVDGPCSAFQKLWVD